MKEWKFRQDLFHRLHKEYADAHDENNVIRMSDTSDEALIKQVVEYFSVIPEKVIYPAKSYMVAIVYARLLRDHFGEDFYEALDDQDLLYGNDPHFVPYSKHKSVYDAVLAQVGVDFDLSKGEIPDVANYFREEFILESD